MRNTNAKLYIPAIYIGVMGYKLTLEPINSVDDRHLDWGHMFAPRPEVALSEMLRVLKPCGTNAFSTWPPELFTGRMFALTAKYLPPPQGVAPPPLWGDIKVVRERLEGKVKNLTFDRDVITPPALSPQHYSPIVLDDQRGEGLNIQFAFQCFSRGLMKKGRF